MRKIIFIILTILIFSSLYSGTFRWNLSNEDFYFQIKKFYEYDLLIIQNGFYIFNPGSPSLPSVSMQFSLPITSRVISAKIENPLWVKIGEYNIMPSQPNIPIGEEAIFFQKMNMFIHLISSFQLILL
ncbi:MAG: hypothetical protein ACP5FK_07810 [bacterium]